MPTYKQRVCFEKSFVIEAPNAEAATEKLRDLVDRVEWDAEVESQGFHEFEDEPVECPACKGACVIGEDEKTCDRCQGNGNIPFAEGQP